MKNLTLTLTTCIKPSLVVSEFYFSDKPVETGFFAGSWEAINRDPCTPNALLQLNELEGQAWVDAINIFAAETLTVLSLANIEVLGSGFGKSNLEPEAGTVGELFCILMSALALRIVTVNQEGVVHPVAEGDVCTWNEALESILHQVGGAKGKVLETYPVVS